MGVVEAIGRRPEVRSITLKGDLDHARPAMDELVGLAERLPGATLSVPDADHRTPGFEEVGAAWGGRFREFPLSAIELGDA